MQDSEHVWNMDFDISDWLIDWLIDDWNPIVKDYFKN
jgi:hypothetical protein